MSAAERKKRAEERLQRVREEGKQWFKELQKLQKPVSLEGVVLVIADVHGNLPALEKALQFAEHHGMTQLLSLGDLLDYNKEGEQVLDRILHHPLLVTALKGNHETSLHQPEPDYYVTEFSDDPVDPTLARAALALPSQVIAHLPTGQEVLLCHDNPWGFTATYLYPDDVGLLEVFLEDIPWSGFWFGHTHIASYHERWSKHAFNPGSLGVSRTTSPDLTFALFHAEAGRIDLYGMHPSLEQGGPASNEPLHLRSLKLPHYPTS